MTPVNSHASRDTYRVAKKRLEMLPGHGYDDAGFFSLLADGSPECRQLAIILICRCRSFGDTQFADGDAAEPIVVNMRRAQSGAAKMARCAAPRRCYISHITLHAVFQVTDLTCTPRRERRLARRSSPIDFRRLPSPPALRASAFFPPRIFRWIAASKEPAPRRHDIFILFVRAYFSAFQGAHFRDCFHETSSRAEGHYAGCGCALRVRALPSMIELYCFHYRNTGICANNGCRRNDNGLFRQTSSIYLFREIFDFIFQCNFLGLFIFSFVVFGAASRVVRPTDGFASFSMRFRRAIHSLFLASEFSLSAEGASAMRRYSSFRRASPGRAPSTPDDGMFYADAEHALAWALAGILHLISPPSSIETSLILGRSRGYRRHFKVGLYFTGD